MEEVMDSYTERAYLISFISRLYPCKLGPAVDCEDDTIFNWILYVDSPEGQLSWHIADWDLHLFDHVTRSMVPIKWDGHSVKEKYDRLNRIEVV